MDENEIKEMSQGGVPYTPEQNKKVQRPPRQEAKQEVGGDGFKYFKKCPTCGQMQEVNSQPAQQVQSDPMNPLIRPFPSDTAKEAPSRIVSDETAEDGTPLVEAKWGKRTSSIPNTPLRR